MGRHSCCAKQKLRKGLWSPEEDEKLYNHITRFGVGCWSSVPKLAGLQRCGKSCRLRWINYLRPDLKRGMFSQEEEDLIINLHKILGNRWAQIAAQLPGRTDNEIKNFWNSSLKKKLMKLGIDPQTHKALNTDINNSSNNHVFRNTTESHNTCTSTPKMEQPYPDFNNTTAATTTTTTTSSTSVFSSPQYFCTDSTYQSLPQSQWHHQPIMPVFDTQQHDHHQYLQSEECFSETLLFREAKESCSSSSSNTVINTTDNQNRLQESEFFQYQGNYGGVIKMELGIHDHHQPSLWEEEEAQFKALSLSEDLVAAATDCNFDAFFQHI